MNKMVKRIRVSLGHKFWTVYGMILLYTRKVNLDILNNTKHGLNIN